MKNSSVSIIVPIYNSQQYLAKCLDGLISQTLKDIEIICVDDGSTDGSIKILENYRRKDQRVKVITQKNQGRSAARNAGLEECKTKYVMFCDSDDYYEPEMCERMVDAIQNNKVDIAICGINIEYKVWHEMKESDDEYYKLHFHGLKKVDDTAIKKTDVSVWNKIFKMDIIDQYHINFPYGINNEDYYFYNAYMSVCKNAFFVQKKLYKYIRQEDSIMSNIYSQNEHSMDHLIVAERLFDFYKKTGFLKEHLDLFWHQWTESFWFVYRYSTKNDRKKIVERAEEFIQKNFWKNEPNDEIVKMNVIGILGQCKRQPGIKGKINRVLSKLNISKKQNNYINDVINQMMIRNEKILDRLDKLKGTIHNDKKK